MKRILILIFALAITLSLGIACFGAEGEEAVAEESENLLDEAYGWLCEHSSEIFSALTLIGSLILSFTYKKGLLPTLSAALNRIGSSVGSFGESASAALDKVGGLEERFAMTEQLCQSLGDRLGELSEKLSASKEERAEKEKMKIILSSQVDMLYEIFISSGLPQYAKEAVGERVKEMKAALTEVTGNE